MEKTFYAANRRVYSLKSESKKGAFFKREYLSENGAQVMERGCTWLGNVKSFRSFSGKLNKIEITASFNLFWLTLPFKLVWFLLVILFELVLWELLKWLGRKCRQTGAWAISLPKKTWCCFVFALAVLSAIWFWPNPYSIEPKLISSENKIEEIMPRQTAIGRAYLDGEENLLGCKYIFGEKAQKFLEEKENNLSTFEEVSDALWVSQVNDLLSPKAYYALTDDQIAVITLLAMRNGEAAFKSSAFLALINEGNFDKAADEIWIFSKEGTPRELNKEGKLYTWCLWALWKGHISFEELWKAKSMGYKDLNVDELYPSGNRFERVYKPEFKGCILNGSNNPIVKEMSFFEGKDNVLIIDTFEYPKDSLWNKVCRFMNPAKKWLRGLFGVV